MNFQTFSEMYRQRLSKVYFDYTSELSPRGLKIRECENVVSIIEHPKENLFTCTARPFPIKYLAGELWWYLTGRNDLKFISQYSSFWKTIANVDGTVNSAYGHLLFKETPNEWAWAYNSLIQDKDSRQAIMHFNKPTHMIHGVKDFPCTIYAIFQIRHNKLNFTVHMRSQDMVKGLTFDLPFFSVLQQCMLQLLQEQYHNICLGSLTSIVNSLHIYESDFALTRKMIVSGFSGNKLPEVDQKILDSNGKFQFITSSVFCKWLDNMLNGGMKNEP